MQLWQQVAANVSLHFGLLGPKNSWPGVTVTSEGLYIWTQHLPAPSLTIWVLYIQMDKEIDFILDVA